MYDQRRSQIVARFLLCAFVAPLVVVLSPLPAVPSASASLGIAPVCAARVAPIQNKVADGCAFQNGNASVDDPDVWQRVVQASVTPSEITVDQIATTTFTVNYQALADHLDHDFSTEDPDDRLSEPRNARWVETVPGGNVTVMYRYEDDTVNRWWPNPYDFSTSPAQFVRIGAACAVATASTCQYRFQLNPNVSAGAVFRWELGDVQVLLPIPHIGDGTDGGVAWVPITIHTGEPVADFTCPPAAASAEAGEYHFVSTSTDTDNNLGFFEWDFGDGTPKVQADNVVHRYTEPGTYTATLRVVDTSGIESTKSCQVVVDPPELGVAITFPPHNETLFNVNESVPVRVTVSAGEGVGDLTNVRVVGLPLGMQPANAFTLASGPTPPIPTSITLAPKTERVFDAVLTAVTPGAFTLITTVAANDSEARPLADVTDHRTGRIGALGVEVTVTPDAIDLEEDEDGPTPQPVDVVIKVTNPYDAAIESVTVRPLAPQLILAQQPPLGYVAFTYLVAPTPPEGEPPNPDAPPVPGVPSDIVLPGTIPAHGSRTITVKGRAVDAGTVDLRVLANATTEDSDTSVGGAGTSRIEIRDKYALYFEAKADEATIPDSGFVLGGEEWKIVGTIENRTVDKTLEVVVMPLNEGNASYGVPVFADGLAPDPECAVGVSRQLDPGESIDFVAPVRTSIDGSTRSTVHYDPLGSILNLNGTKTALTDSDVLISAASREVSASVDTRDRVPEATVGEVIWTYGSATIDAFAEMVGGMAWLGIQAGVLALQPWMWFATYEAAGNKLAEYIDNVYLRLSPADRQAWKDDWIFRFQAATAIPINDVRAMFDDVVLESFTELENAVWRDDSLAVATWWGTLTGNAPDVALAGLGKALGVCRLIAKSTPWARRALASAELKLLEEVEALGARLNAENYPTGAAIERAARRGIWGIDDVMDRMVQAFVDEYNIIIGVRRRGPGSIGKVEAGTHYPKPYKVKAKNTSAFDVEWMRMIDDLDTAAIKQPPRLSTIETRLNAVGADADLTAEVLARLEQRAKEWYGKGPKQETDFLAWKQWLEDGTGADFSTSERAKWLKYAQDGLPVPAQGSALDYADNVRNLKSLPPDDIVYTKVPARIREFTAPDGRPQMVLEIDRGSGFKPITGDMDPVIVAKPDFTQLTLEKRLEFYRRAHELGFEHVESASWMDPAGRNAYLEEFSIHNPTGEAIFTWIPKSVPRATRFDPQKSWIHPSDKFVGTAFYMHGSQMVIKSQDPTLGPLPIEMPDREGGYINPKTIFLVNPSCPGPGGARVDVSPGPSVAAVAGTCTVQFDRGPNALILREAPDGRIERWMQATGWQPLNLATAGAIGVLPQTVASEGTAAGAVRIEIVSEGDLGLVAGVDDWFEVGDVVVIDPGGPNEEFAVIGGFGSLIFTAPLTKAHAPGETISVVTPAAAPVTPPTTPPVTPPTPPPTTPPTPPPTTPPPITPPITPAPTPVPPIETVPTGALPNFTAVAPERIFDTRGESANALRIVTVAKVGGANVLEVKMTDLAGVVPVSGVGAVSLNVAVTNPERAGFVTVFPCSERILVASVNYVAGQTVSNAVVAPVSPTGTVCFYSLSMTDIIVDLNGWFAAGAAFTPIAPQRVFDTRGESANALRQVPQAKVVGDIVLEVKLADLPGAVPATGVGAVSLNVAVTNPAAAGFVTVFPCGTRKLVASVNYVGGQTVSNAVIAPVSASGTVCFYSLAPTDIIVDVNGWFAAGAAFTAVAPERVFDTRGESANALRHVRTAKVGGDNVLEVKLTDLTGVVPATGVGAVSLNVAVTNPAAAGFVTVFPCGTRKLVASVNHVAGQTVSNAVIAPVSATGTVCFYSLAPTDIIVDVNGWFAST